LSLVGAGILGDTTVEFWDEVLELAWNIILKLSLGPVVMKEAAESAVWMGVLWHWASDVWLWVLRVPDVSFKLSLSPIVVKEAAESAVWMSIFGHWTSDVWLRILVSLNLSPVIVEVTRES
jgi:hypothetical protein